MCKIQIRNISTKGLYLLRLLLVLDTFLRAWLYFLCDNLQFILLLKLLIIWLARWVKSMNFWRRRIRWWSASHRHIAVRVVQRRGRVILLLVSNVDRRWGWGSVYWQFLIATCFWWGLLFNQVIVVMLLLIETAFVTPWFYVPTACMWIISTFIHCSFTSILATVYHKIIMPLNSIYRSFIKTFSLRIFPHVFLVDIYFATKRLPVCHLFRQ